MKLNTKKIYIWGGALIAVLVGSFNMAAFNSDGLKPPRLEYDGGYMQTSVMNDGEKYFGFSEDEENEFEGFDENKLHKAGINYVYCDKSMQVKDVIKMIKPDVQGSFVIAKYAPDEGKFYTFPKGPFKDTGLLNPNDLIWAGTGFVIVSNKDFETNDSIKSANEEPNACFDNLTLLDNGWHLLAVKDSEYMQALLDQTDVVKDVFIQEGENDFNLKDENSEFNGFYLAWFLIENNLAEKYVNDNPSEVSSVELENTSYGVNVTWDEADDDLGIAGYQIHYGLEPVLEPGQVYSNILDVGNVSEYLFTELTVGETYYFNVVAYDLEGLESIAWAEEQSVVVENNMNDVPNETL